MQKTRGSESASQPAGQGQAPPDLRTGLVLALIFGAVCGGSACTLWPSRAAAPPAPGRAVLRLDPNTASQTELLLLPGIGPRLSRSIIEHREGSETRPAFRAAEDLDAVRGVGPAGVARLRDSLQFEPRAE